MIPVFNNFNLNTYFLFLNLILLFLLIEYSANNNLSFNINEKHLAPSFKTFSIMIYSLLVSFPFVYNSSNTVYSGFDYKFSLFFSCAELDISFIGSIADFFYNLIAIIYSNFSFSSSSFSIFG